MGAVEQLQAAPRRAALPTSSEHPNLPVNVSPKTAARETALAFTMGLGELLHRLEDA